MKFEEKLLKLRKEKGLSQEGLAEKLEVSRQAISRWESGDSTPDMGNLISICNFFNVSSDYLILDIQSIESKSSEPKKDTAAQKTPHFLIYAIYSLIAVCTAICGIVYVQNTFQLILSLLCCAIFSVTAAVQFVLFFKKPKKNQKNE